MTEPVTRCDLVYDEAHDLRLDLHLAPEPASAPVVLYVHGGGFARGARADHPDRLAGLAAAGLTVASVDYRLAPDVRHPAAIEDVIAAAAYLVREAGALGLPAGPLGAIGASAGGYLVSMAALTGAAMTIAAVSPWFAPFDFVATSRRTPLEQRALPVGFEINLLGDLNPERLRGASATSVDLSAAPAFLLCHGDSDRIVAPDQSEAMHRALLAAGRDSTLVLLGGAGHEDARFDRAPHLPLVAGWFRSVLGPR